MSLKYKSRFDALAMWAKSFMLESFYKRQKKLVIYYDIYIPDTSDSDDEEQTLHSENTDELPE